MRSEEREALRAQKATERDELRKLPDAFKLNLGANPDRFYEIIMGTYKPPTIEGEDPRITRPINENKFVTQSRKQRGEDMDYEEDGSVDEAGEPTVRRAGNISPRTAAPRANPKYASVISELERFDFNEDPQKRETQMTVVAQYIRNAIQELRLRDVAANTRQAYGKYIKGIGKAAGGIDVCFDFGSGPIHVIAQGSFYGDETVCMYADNGNAKAAVMKISNGQKGVLEGFNVTIKKSGESK